MFCVKCGNEVDLSGNFCQHCGKPINKGQETIKESSSIPQPPEPQIVHEAERFEEPVKKSKKGVNWYRIAYLFLGIGLIGCLAATIIPLMAGTPLTAQAMKDTSFLMAIIFAVRFKEKNKSGIKGFAIGFISSFAVLYLIAYGYVHFHKKQAPMYKSEYSVSNQQLPNVYKGDDYEIRFPSDWKVIPPVSPKINLQITSDNGYGEADCMIMIDSVPPEKLKYSNSEYVNSLTADTFINQFKSKIPDVAINNSGKINLADSEAYRWDVTATYEGILKKQSVINTVNNGKYFTTICGAESTKYNKNKESIDRILSSIRFIK